MYLFIHINSDVYLYCADSEEKNAQVKADSSGHDLVLLLEHKVHLILKRENIEFDLRVKTAPQLLHNHVHTQHHHTATFFYPNIISTHLIIPISFMTLVKEMGCHYTNTQSSRQPC